jgi:outer membrane protein assembly factor BamB
MTFSARIVLGAFFVLAFAIHAADWPQWRGPRRDGHMADESTTLTRLPSAPKVAWRTKAGEGLASPVVAQNFVFAFDTQDGKETLRCLRAENGTEVWRTPIDEPFKDAQGPTGPRCTPVVDSDLVFVQSCRGSLQCLSVSDGKKIWGTSFTKDFGAIFTGEKGNAQGAARHGNNGSPLIDGNFLYAQVGASNASVVCFEKRTGNVVWKSQDDVAGYAAPVIAELAGTRQVVSFTADGVIGLDAKTGRLLWRFPVKTAYSRHATTPVIHGNKVIVSSHQVGLMALEISRDGQGQKVEQKWLSKEAALNFASPVLVGRHLFGLGPRKNVVCVDAETGRLAWSKDGWWTTSADKAYGGFIAVGENILALTDTGTLVLFAADPKGARELGQAQVCGANWCNPALANGRLYLRDGLRQNGDWLCVELK